MRLLSHKVNPRLFLNHGISGGGASNCTHQSGDELTLSSWDKDNYIISKNIDNGTNPRGDVFGEWAHS
ncbi:hypothetical protein, partial [Porphyromonas sp. HMSC065F10]|uniref:hypothetical protein n=1 Tax=Porphyromonas sp. HMSC065F10 TaxID=1739394 RepID=UPI001AEF8311